MPLDDPFVFKRRYGHATYHGRLRTPTKDYYDWGRMLTFNFDKCRERMASSGLGFACTMSQTGRNLLDTRSFIPPTRRMYTGLRERPPLSSPRRRPFFFDYVRSQSQWVSGSRVGSLPNSCTDLRADLVKITSLVDLWPACET